MKPVKLFDDYLQMAADANQMTREEYAATYLSERNLDINRYSPMAYAQRVLDGQMEIIAAAKESGLGVAGLIKLIKKLDKNFKWSLNEAGDHEVGMSQSQLEAIIDAAIDLQEKIGSEEKDIPGWIQDHISQSYNYIKQANDGYHELEENFEVNEKMKIFMKNIISKMVPAAFGASSSVQMREEMKDAIAKAIEPILLKYDYVVEANESVKVKKLDTLIDVLSNLEDAFTEEEFVEFGEKDLKISPEVMTNVWNGYWDLGAMDRLHFNIADWKNWLKKNYDIV